jgi:hypothetical protein
LLRFGGEKLQRRTRATPQTRGVWMLLLMLGAVLMLMRQLQQPETAGLLGRLFSASRSENASNAAGQATAESDRAVTAAADALTPAQQKLGPWAQVKDNATFLPAETEAWFLLWEEVRGKPVEELARASTGEVAYAQLVEQPDVYRGQPVRIRGRVLRETTKRAPTNSLGIDSYHQLTLAPRGGGDWPIIVYCLELPAGFPRGDNLAVDLEAVGLFFKNWSYAYDGGLGLAPVLVNRTVNWQAPKSTLPVSPTVDSKSALWAVGSAGVAVSVFLVWAVRQTRRRQPAESPAPNFESLDTSS